MKDKGLIRVIIISSTLFFFILLGLSIPETRPWTQKVCSGIVLLCLASVAIAGSLLPFIHGDEDDTDI